MPDIAKINAVALADIEKVDGILAANIEKVNGLTLPGTAPFVGLLDTYTGAAAGYSVRRLATSATVLMRVRRDTGGGTGDDDEADVAYDSNNILSLDSAISNASAGVTATTLGQFINVGTVNGTTYTNPDSLTVTASCLVDTWYDQVGSNDAEQANQGNQPKIHDGTADTDLITDNGKPAAQFDSAQTLIPPSAIWDKDDFSSFLVGNAHAADDVFLSFSPDEVDWAIYVVQQKTSTTLSTRLWLDSAAADVASGDNALNTQVLVSSVADVSLSDLQSFIDGSEITGTTIANGSVGTTTIGASNAAFGRGLNGTIQELVFFGDAKSSTDRSDIEDNINSEYLIYQPTTQPTSGLLYDYGSATGGTDAAAAYSVRQLSDKAVLCMRIRRDMGAGNPGDDDETNIGFDSNGDLDTQAISDFCTTGTGYVTRWWDQSTNGNHADQPVGGTGSNTNQPQIYDGTAVITENGKPTLKFADDTLVVSSPSGFSGKSQSIFNVGLTIRSTGPNNPDFFYGLGDASPSTGALRGLTQELYLRFQGTTQDYDSLHSANTQRLYSLVCPPTVSTIDDYDLYRDGLLLTPDSSSGGTINNVGTGVLVIGSNTLQSATTNFQGNQQEVIFWNSDQSSNRTGIESNVMTYFNIP